MNQERVNKTVITQRKPVLVEQAQRVSDGAGVKIFRNIAFQQLHRFDPFLLLDELGSDDAADYIGGFPNHPHRGFQTFTYLLEGKMLHSDHLGNSGLLERGGAQWMKAGSGVIHSEMPQQESGLLHGFQLWVNLPSTEKMTQPAYQDIPSEAFPSETFGETNQSQITVLSGEFSSHENTLIGPVSEHMPGVEFYDVQLQSGDEFNALIGADKNVMVYVFAGRVKFAANDAQLKAQQIALMDEGDAIQIDAESDARFLVIAGYALQEPIAHWGPFVMNTRDEIEQAVQDYRDGKIVQHTNS